MNKNLITLALAIALGACGSDSDNGGEQATNTPANITGTSTALIQTTDTQFQGTLTISDEDEGEATFKTQSRAPTTYGNFSITENGTWEYVLDTTNDAIIALAPQQTVTDTVNIESVDGTKQTIIITIEGAAAATVSSCTGLKVIPISTTTATAEQNPNIATNATDGDNSTRWSAGAEDPTGVSEAITFELDEESKIKQLELLWLKADQRSTYYEVETSADNTTWTPTLTSGVTARITDGSFEIVDLSETEGKYVRITSTGNDSGSGWISLLEAHVLGCQAGDAFEDPIKAVISGDTAGAASEDDVTSATGTLTVVDPNTDEAAFVASDIDGTYGSLSITTSGTWTYTLSNDSAAVQNLISSSSETDSFTVKTVDGTTETINIAITSADDDVSDIPNGEATDADAFAAQNDGTVSVTGTTYTIDADDLSETLALATGGDEIVITSGDEFSIRDVSFDSPVLIRAATIGGLTLENATIKSSNNIALQGFVFGPNDNSTLLKIENSTNIKVLRNTFDHKDVLDSQSTIVLTQASQYIEIAYNTFKDKNLSTSNPLDTTKSSKLTGSYIKTQLDEDDATGDLLMTKNMHIHHNHFDNIAYYWDPTSNNGAGGVAGDSDREAIAMGIADSQDIVTNNVIEYNLFENCDGENEIITVKTSNNIFRHNTFKNSMGSLSFRLGSNNEASNNYFYGTDSGATLDDENYQTGGIRVYGEGHKVTDNYMEGLTGSTWRLPLLLDNGDTSDSTGGDSHETPTNVEVSGNTVVNSAGGIHIGRASNTKYGNAPKNNTINNNIVVGNQGDLFENDANDSSNTWSGNQVYATGTATAVSGGALITGEVELLTAEPSITKPTPLTAADVGPDAL